MECMSRLTWTASHCEDATQEDDSENSIVRGSELSAMLESRYWATLGRMGRAL